MHTELLDNELASTDSPNKGEGFLPTFVRVADIFDAYSFCLLSCQIHSSSNLNSALLLSIPPWCSCLPLIFFVTFRRCDTAHCATSVCNLHFDSIRIHSVFAKEYCLQNQVKWFQNIILLFIILRELCYGIYKHSNTWAEWTIYSWKVHSNHPALLPTGCLHHIIFFLSVFPKQWLPNQNPMFFNSSLFQVFDITDFHILYWRTILCWQYVSENQIKRV